MIESLKKIDTESDTRTEKVESMNIEDEERWKTSVFQQNSQKYVYRSPFNMDEFGHKINVL